MSWASAAGLAQHNESHEPGSKCMSAIVHVSCEPAAGQPTGLEWTARRAGQVGAKAGPNAGETLRQNQRPHQQQSGSEATMQRVWNFQQTHQRST